MRFGRLKWALAGGRIPLASNGPEPAFTSRDQLSLLNTGSDPAEVEMTLYYSDRAQVGPYRFTVPAHRLRRIRVNDLIEPQAPPLDEPCAVIIDATSPIVVQFTRQDTSGRHVAGLMTTAFAVT